MDAQPETQQVHGRRILVVGGGLIGGSLVARLATTGAEIVLLTRSRPRPWLQSALGPTTLIVGDAGDPARTREALTGVDHVVYCAGDLLPGPPGSESAVDIALELRPLVAVLDAIRGAGRGSILYLSSGGTVYGKARHLPIDEAHPTNPITPYGAAKLAGERMVQSYAVQHGVRTRILRCANVFGEHQRTDRQHGAIAVFLARLMHGEPIVLYGDGSAVRDFVDVSDVVEAIVRLLTLDDGHVVVNVGSGVGTSLRELVRLLEDAMEQQARIDHRSSRPFDLPSNVLDITLLRKLIGFEPTPLAEGLVRITAAMRARSEQGSF